MQKALTHLRKGDPVLSAILDSVGAYRIEYRDPDFDTLVRSIVYQQLSGRVARVIFERLQSAACVNGERLNPERILRLRPAKMRRLGVSPQKTEYIRDLARRTFKGQIDFSTLASLADEEVIEALTQVKGIGVWTAQMFLIFALRRPNILPVGDLGIRVAMKRAYSLPDLPPPAEMKKIAAPWEPYCSVACWYLWRSLDNQAAL